MTSTSVEAAPDTNAIRPSGSAGIPSARVAAVGPGHPSALILASESDLLTIGIAGWLDPLPAALGLLTFAIPLDLPSVELGLAWHPRTAADPAQAWFRHHARGALLASS
ncbi:hypothetical protein [Amycolatopsis sp. La24]|uniref:hypothetical protein n=1 Tax=Amycolatopsis sp. La24 TaxID=3028304 RepID=UPI0023AF7B25|nr:hypothetical protein [Amycolatopsis sp. La24]